MRQGNNDLKIRPADWCDSAVTYLWVNNLQTRLMSFNTAIIKQDEHEAWFRESLSMPNRHIFICDDQITQESIGIVRFDISGYCAVVSINLAPKMRGKNKAKFCLIGAVDALVRDRPELETIKAKIKIVNIASRRAFESAGFILESKDTHQICLKLNVRK